MEVRLPQPERISLEGRSASDRPYPKAKFLHAAADWGSLSKDWVAFTPGPAYLFGRFNDAYFHDLEASTGRPVPIHWKVFDDPVFHGLVHADGDAEWNHSLFLVPASDWQAMLDFMCTITVFRPKERFVAHYGEQELLVPDPFALEARRFLSPDQPPMRVSAFGVLSNKYIGRFVDSPDGRPRFGLTLPSTDTATFAAAVLRDDNPVVARDTARYDRDVRANAARVRPDALQAADAAAQGRLRYAHKAHVRR